MKILSLFWGVSILNILFLWFLRTFLLSTHMVVCFALKPYINTKFGYGMNANYYKTKLMIISEDRRDNPFMKLWDLIGDIDTGEYNTEEFNWKADLEILRLTLMQILNNRIVEEYDKI